LTWGRRRGAIEKKPVRGEARSGADHGVTDARMRGIHAGVDDGDADALAVQFGGSRIVPRSSAFMPQRPLGAS
jgi:hypothetical protein